MRHYRVFYSALLLLLVVTWTTAASGSTGYGALSPEQVHLALRELYQHGDMVALEKTAKQVIEENQAAVQDTRSPTPYQYMGVAQYALGDLDQATRTFEEAVRVNDGGVDSWL